MDNLTTGNEPIDNSTSQPIASDSTASEAPVSDANQDHASASGRQALMTLLAAADNDNGSRIATDTHVDAFISEIEHPNKMLQACLVSTGRFTNDVWTTGWRFDEAMLDLARAALTELRNTDVPPASIFNTVEATLVACAITPEPPVREVEEEDQDAGDPVPSDAPEGDAPEAEAPAGPSLGFLRPQAPQETEEQRKLRSLPTQVRDAAHDAARKVLGTNAGAAEAQRHILYEALDKGVEGTLAFFSDLAVGIDTLTIEDEEEDDVAPADSDASGYAAFKRRERPRRRVYQLTTLLRMKPQQMQHAQELWDDLQRDVLHMQLEREVRAYNADVGATLDALLTQAEALGIDLKAIGDIRSWFRMLVTTNDPRVNELFATLYVPAGKKWRQHRVKEYVDDMAELDLGQRIGAVYRFFSFSGSSIRDVIAPYLEMLRKQLGVRTPKTPDSGLSAGAQS